MEVRRKALVCLLFFAVSAWALPALSALPPATAPPGTRIVRLVLVNACNDADLRPLQASDSIGTADCMNVRADVAGSVDSVRFEIEGPDPSIRIENVAPFAFAGDSGGDYFEWGVRPGTYRITAVPFMGPNGTGRAGAGLVRQITVRPPASTPPPPTQPAPVVPTPRPSPPTPTIGARILRFVLVNACGSSTDLRVLASRDTLDTSRCISIRADATADVASVRFEIEGPDPSVRVENVAPYALAGDSAGNFFAWGARSGTYRVRATPFNRPNGQGQSGTPLTAQITVRGSVAAGPPAPPPAGPPAPPPPPTPSVPPAPAPEPRPAPAAASGQVSGELRKWHKVTVSFAGPEVDELSSPNPFRDYRLDVTFTHEASGRRWVVPGYFAADGNAAHTSASRGQVWRAHLAPPVSGPFTYRADFRTGSNVAVSGNGAPTSFHGATGRFHVGEADASAPGFYATGRLTDTRDGYYRFGETGEYFLKGGAGSPENLLAYFEFDNTRDRGGRSARLTNGLHRFNPHVRDWRSGDPLWQGNKGRGIIGALNYLAAEGMNSVYFLTMNVNGDGNDLHPWIAENRRDRYDASKLDQWEIVFEHMDRLGLAMHVVTQEQENDQLLDGGNLGAERRIYYRELIARFGHHLGVIWNLGEENTNTHDQRVAFANYFRTVDPYDHPTVVHTYPFQRDAIYGRLLGLSTVAGPSIQAHRDEVHRTVTRWVDRSRGSAHRWVVSVDEVGPANLGVVPDRVDPLHDAVRHRALWGTFMAGGAGVEWYFGYDHEHGDVDAEDFRSRRNMWQQTRYALEFFQRELPFWRMTHADSLTPSGDDYVFANPGEVYAIYRPRGGATLLNLSGYSGTFDVRWYNPRNGGALATGSIGSVEGGGRRDLGQPPHSGHLDWVAIVRNRDAANFASPSASPPPVAAPPPATVADGLAVTQLVLVDACLDRDLYALGSRETIDLGRIGNCMNVRADTTAGVASVRFELGSQTSFRVENAAPFAAAGDRDGEYQILSLGPGRYRLRAVPYGGIGGTGASGSARSVELVVVGTP